MKKSLLEEIQVLDVFQEERVRRAKAKTSLENIAILQEVNWR